MWQGRAAGVGSSTVQVNRDGLDEAHLNSTIHWLGMLPRRATMLRLMPCSYTWTSLPSFSSTWWQQSNQGENRGTVKLCRTRMARRCYV